MKTNRERHADICIIGSGIAGTLAALELASARPDLRIELFSKGALDAGASSMAQGGIAVPRFNDPSDVHQHVQDTLSAGHRSNNEDTVRRIIGSAHHVIGLLERYGVQFDRAGSDYHYAREGGHAVARVIHVADRTGYEVMRALHGHLCAQRKICTRVHTAVTDVSRGPDDPYWTLTAEEEASGRLIERRGSRVVLAMGGSGWHHRWTSNPVGAVGDALKFAGRLGLPVQELDAMQFHPTAIYSRDQDQPLSLVTEALRGAGARIVNAAGESFVREADARGDLAPRDIVTTAILEEMALTGADHVYLDARQLDPMVLRERFPTFLRTCAEHSIDPTTTLIPIRPAAHYQCGGIVADINGRTAVDGIDALGECAYTGMHGRNRLASNSLLEAAVMALMWAKRCATEEPTAIRPTAAEYDSEAYDSRSH